MRTHLGHYKFWCEECKKGYQDISNYKYHMAKHEGRTYPCQLCPKRFSSDKTLKAHQAEHTGNYPFSCSYCQEGFIKKQKWVEHENQHAGIQFPCRTCRKVFNLDSKRDMHERSCSKYMWLRCYFSWICLYYFYCLNLDHTDPIVINMFLACK